jgi:2-oxoglutarate/2-oxoacid ferredoxin oxidoreductase subunit alpha
MRSWSWHAPSLDHAGAPAHALIAARTVTCTSGPGVSLVTEFLGLAYCAEILVTIINVQRGGPSTGMPTRTQQADLVSCAYASHGDTKHVLLLPQDPNECFEFAATALDVADRMQAPEFVMTDLDIGMNLRLCKPFAWDDAREYDRGKVLTHAPAQAAQGLRPHQPHLGHDPYPGPASARRGAHRPAVCGG